MCKKELEKIKNKTNTDGVMMEVVLEKAVESDANIILNMQIKAFTSLLEKYRDYKTNSANETIDRVIVRINNHNGGFY